MDEKRKHEKCCQHGIVNIFYMLCIVILIKIPGRSFCRSHGMLENEYALARIGTDTAENEHKNLPNFGNVQADLPNF